MVNAMAALGISMDLRSMPMKGTAAWTAVNHERENFFVCSLHIPNGMFAAIPMAPITSTFVDSDCGLRFLANAVRDIAALAATTAAGHFNCTPGGGWMAFATSGRTLLTARYDFAIGQFPLCNHSLLSASCFELPPCEELSLDDFEFFLLFFHFFENASKPKGPPSPKPDRLMVAAFAAKGLNWADAGSDFVFSFQMDDLPESGTTPSCPWKSRKAVSKLGPSSKIGPLPSRTGIEKAIELEKEKFVGSLMLRKNGHLIMSC